MRIDSIPIALLLVILFVFDLMKTIVSICSYILGTVFMARLQEQLKYFVNMKITQDEMWQGLDIYLSGHEVKIMKI